MHASFRPRISYLRAYFLAYWNSASVLTLPDMKYSGTPRHDGGGGVKSILKVDEIKFSDL